MFGFTLATVLDSPVMLSLAAIIGCLAVVSVFKLIRAIADDILTNEWGE